MLTHFCLLLIRCRREHLIFATMSLYLLSSNIESLELQGLLETRDLYFPILDENLKAIEGTKNIFRLLKVNFFPSTIAWIVENLNRTIQQMFDVFYGSLSQPSQQYRFEVGIRISEGKKFKKLSRYFHGNLATDKDFPPSLRSSWKINKIAFALFMLCQYFQSFWKLL